MMRRTIPKCSSRNTFMIKNRSIDSTRAISNRPRQETFLSFWSRKLKIGRPATLLTGAMTSRPTRSKRSTWKTCRNGKVMTLSARSQKSITRSSGTPSSSYSTIIRARTTTSTFKITKRLPPARIIKWSGAPPFKTLLLGRWTSSRFKVPKSASTRIFARSLAVDMDVLSSSKPVDQNCSKTCLWDTLPSLYN